MQKITPFLWFDSQAEEAAAFYTSVFKNSKVTNVSRYGEGTPGTPGTVMMVNFEIEGQPFMALNGGPVFTFSPATSFLVDCATQEEVDDLWEKLSESGEQQQCGWLRDKYGVTWQIVPSALGELMQSGDAEQSQRVMAALLKMGKIDIATLRRAYEGR